MEDSLFPLSPSADHKLGEDSMECTATDLLLEEGVSLFNDSLDNDDTHNNAAAKAIAAAATECDPTEERQDLNDSLGFDETQLQSFDESNKADPLQLLSDGGDPITDVATMSKGGFELAKNIAISCSSTEDNKSIESEENQEIESNTACGGNNTLPVDSRVKTLSTAASTKGSTTRKTSKVVPNFGRKKTNTDASPNAKKTGAKSSNKVNAVVPADDHLPNEGEEINESGVKSGDSDQCVPQDTAGEDQPQLKPQFGAGSTSKHAVKKSTSGTTSNKDKKKTATPKNKSTTTKAPLTGGKGDQSRQTRKDEHQPNSTNTSGSADNNMADGGVPVNTTATEQTVAQQPETKEEKQAEQEQKKSDREEKRRETERKKLEREEKKRETEAKKAEKERLKREKQLELEKKKAEREQKKIEQALKKAERMANKDKQGGERTNKKSKDTSAKSETQVAKETKVDQNEQEEPADTTGDVVEDDQVDTSSRKSGRVAVVGVTQPEEGASLPTDTNTNSQPTLPGVGYGTNTTDLEEPQESTAILPEDTAEEAACDVNSDRDGGVSDGSGDQGNRALGGEEDSQASENQEKSVLRERNLAEQSTPKHKQERVDKENSEPQTDTPAPYNSCSVNVEKLKIVFGKSRKVDKKDSVKATRPEAKRGSTENDASADTAASAGNQKKKPQAKASKPKKRARAREEKGNGSGEREDKKCSKQSNYVGPVWVQCEKVSCQKWRKLRECSDPLSLPDSWTCSMNTDSERNTCSAEEETWSEEMGDSQEFIETPFIPGSLVWAKMDSYPWWPAMIEEDPDDEAYYELGKRNTSNIPVRYHVVFFDTPVSRGWVSSFHIQPYTDDADHNTTTGVSVPQKLKHSLKEARKQASGASTMEINTRLVECSFSKRFRRMSSKRRRTAQRKELDKEGKDVEICKGETKRQKISHSKVAERKSARLGRGQRVEGAGVMRGGSEEGDEESVGGCEGVGEVGSEEEKDQQTAT